MSRWPGTLLVFIGAVALPGDVRAQTRDVAAVEHELAQLGTNDLPELHLRARRIDTTNVSTRRDALTERGLVYLRIAALSGDADAAASALDLFDNLADRWPDYPWAHYGVARARLLRPDVAINWFWGVFSGITMPQVAAEIVGQDPRSRALRSLQRALELDPLFAPAAIELAREALRRREPEQLALAQQALQRVQQGRRGEATAVWLADVAVAAGDLLAAEAAATELTEFASDSSVALNTRAGILFRMPGQEMRALDAYYAGIERLTPAAADRYYADVSLIVTEQEEQEWPAASVPDALEQQRAWLHRFWDIRAARSAVRVEQRIAEHYRRLDIVRSRFRRSQMRGPPPVRGLLLESERDRQPFDDRGLVYVRYGRPDDVIRTVGQSLYPNETWVYDNVDGERIHFHFVALRGAVDFTLVDDIFSAMREPTPDRSVIALLDDRVKINPQYGILATRLRGVLSRTLSSTVSASGGPGQQLQSIRTASDMLSGAHRQDVLADLRRENGTPDFANLLPFYYDIFGLRGPVGRTQLTAAFAVPGNVITPRDVNGRFLYSVDVSLIVIDTATSHVERADTILNFWSSRRLSAGENLRFHIDLATAPSASLTHRVALRDGNAPGVGNVYGGPLEALDYRGRNLVISDIVIADSSQYGSWHRDSIELELLPPRRILSEQPFSLFYEIYNLPTDEPYRTDLSIERTDGSGLIGGIKRLFGGSDGVIRLSFEGVAASNVQGTQAELRRVSASLEPGRYRLTVRATNLRTGQEARREKLFLVIPRNNQ